LAPRRGRRRPARPPDSRSIGKSRCDLRPTSLMPWNEPMARVLVSDKYEKQATRRKRTQTVTIGRLANPPFASPSTHCNQQGSQCRENTVTGGKAAQTSSVMDGASDAGRNDHPGEGHIPSAIIAVNCMVTWLRLRRPINTTAMPSRGSTVSTTRHRPTLLNGRGGSRWHSDSTLFETNHIYP